MAKAKKSAQYSDGKYYDGQRWRSRRDLHAEINGYENDFAEKYIGYLRRENEGSKYGSYPLHDDYTEESFPD